MVYVWGFSCYCFIVLMTAQYMHNFCLLLSDKVIHTELLLVIV